MKVRVCLELLMGIALMGPGASPAAEIRTVTGQPLVDVVQAEARAIRTAGAVRVPMITWGGDVATMYARDQGHFQEQGLDVALFVENNFQKQVTGALEGETPYVRGTLGMINAAAEVFAREGIELTVIYQLTWSTGGDAIVGRAGIETAKDLAGKTVALQRHGPHMDYLGTVLNRAGVPIDRVTFQWFEELAVPTHDTGGRIVDPASAFLQDDRIDAAMTILPDALNLTSGGEGGTGAAGSVKGARILVSTQTASRAVADVYAVRGDYLASNRADVERFVRALTTAEEAFSTLMAERSSRRAQFQKVLATAADKLLGSPLATPDVEALLDACAFVGRDGNIAFFTGQDTSRTMARLTSELQTNLIQVGLIRGRPTLAQADWDYGVLAGGLTTDTTTTVAATNTTPTNTTPTSTASTAPTNVTPTNTTPSQRVVGKVEKQALDVPTTQARARGTFQVEINFEPNQSDFSESQYADAFQQVLEAVGTNGGGLVVIEGHSDPTGVLEARQNGEPGLTIRQMERQAKNLALERSRAVRSSLLAYAEKRNVAIDATQFRAVGLGIETPKFSPPRTKEEWAANRRVVFQIDQVGAGDDGRAQRD